MHVQHHKLHIKCLLKHQQPLEDYFRFSKDALVYLFKDFNNLELFPYRGRYSHAFNIMFPGRWKNFIEKTSINMFLDKFASDEKNSKQCSGFYFIAKK